MEEAQSDTEKETTSIIMPSLSHALEGLRTLLRYKEHCEDTRIGKTVGFSRSQQQDSEYSRSVDYKKHSMVNPLLVMSTSPRQSGWNFRRIHHLSRAMGSN